jgi:hypothetical protein
MEKGRTNQTGWTSWTGRTDGRARGGGRCLFRVVGKTDYQEEIEGAIGAE